MLCNQRDNEKRIPCPYDPSHIILYYRMQTHLVKCRRNHPESHKVPCAYNATHQIPEPELTYHHEVCPDRIGLDKQLFATENADLNRFPVPDLNVQADESWDDEQHPTYNPQEHCLNKVILRNSVINTQPAATRRNFRMEERQRIQQLMDQRSASRNGPEVAAHQRLPVSTSGGVQNRAEIVDNAPFDVARLLAQVNLGSSTLTTPRLNASDISETEQETAGNEDGPEDQANNEDRINENDVTNQHDIKAESYVEHSGRSTGAVPRPTNPAYNRDFPALGAPRSMNRENRSQNGANFPNKSMSRGRGSQFAKK